ncbi:MAG: hypothetical protein JWM68_2274 [Verrucomicrobiales bacterium]|nr:hypothetical protein [Verrucomicrobiales bacterium]
MSMSIRRISAFALLICGLISLRAEPGKVSINSDQVMVINGKKVFPIGFTMPPPPDGKTPEGKNAIQELSDAGANFMRTGAWGSGWNKETIALEQKYEDAAAKYGMHCLPYLKELAAVKPGNKERAKQLEYVVKKFRDHPGLGAWKGEDEPEWGKQPLEPLLTTRDIIRKQDANHPIVIIHAPRGTVETLRPYNQTGDIIGADVYPVSYPPASHSLLANKELSMVGDYTRTMMETANGKMPVWMVLQIAWSGVLKEGKTLRFPTFPQERFMTYQAIINGARGLLYFGGNIEIAQSAADAKLGWNWRFWNRVLRPVIEEIGDKSPLNPALLVADSKLPVLAAVKESSSGKAPKETAIASPNRPFTNNTTNLFPIEFCVREVGDEIFVLACNRENDSTLKVQFSGLPATSTGGDMMFEEPRKVSIKNGKFSDWFGPFEVHVYRFKR